MKNLEERHGYANRNIVGVPKEKCVIRVIVPDYDGEHLYICEWIPYNGLDAVFDGYLGTAKVILGEYKGIGFHAWDQNNNEFVYYQTLTFTPSVANIIIT